MTGTEAIGYIENYTWSTTRLGLDRTRALLQALGNPQKKLRFVHVAGSNGKGSTCAMLDAILRTAGYRVGLYTSPYIQDFCERMQVNGQNISGDRLASITERVKAVADSMADHPSQFELVTAIAMEYFYESECEIVVLEVGMGGALDSTNVIDCPEVAVITNIGLEHTEYLGNTLQEIAAAKGGIIKPCCTAVCYECHPEVTETLRKICSEQGAEYRCASAEELRVLTYALSGQTFLWKGKEYALSLLGEHQIRNAGVVLETVSALRERGWNIPEEAVKNALKDVRWPARFEVLQRKPLFILDGGHNPQCAEALVKNLNEYLPGQKVTFLIGVLADKDYRTMLDLILPFSAECVCVTPENPRALPAAKLAEEISHRGSSCWVCRNVQAGIRKALQSSRPVIAFGSLYLAGQVRTAFFSEIKKMQRKAALLVRDSLSENLRKEKSRHICEKICLRPEYQTSKTIMLYKAFRSEVDLSAFEEQARADGKTLLYPYCLKDYKMLALLPGSAWEKDAYGISVPVLAESQAVPPDNIDLVLCPCAAFDDGLHRLGMGAGYYDRFLPQCINAVKMLVAFKEQKLEQVCTDRYDVKMDAVISD